MRLLILGGTVFLGRHLVEVARAQGHELTLFHRGRSTPGLFSELETLHGDRDEGAAGLAALAGRTWDAVIDTSGYLPGLVEASARFLTGSVGAYAFVSTISVMANPSAARQTEDTALAQLPPGARDDVLEMRHYGALKALCEQRVREQYGDRSLIARPGLIVGPHDPTDRFTYWPRRLAQGGEVLAPPAEQLVQLIDARDLAAWILHALEQQIGGTHFATGPAAPTSMAEALAACSVVAPEGTRLVPVDEAFLIEQQVEPFTELPLWVPSESAGFLDVDTSSALARGLEFRPLGDSARDTLAWDQTRDPGEERTAGLDPAREAQLLEAWRRREV